MTGHHSALGRVVVRLRWPILLAWIAAAALATVALPTIEEAQDGALGDLVPASSAALDGERGVAGDARPDPAEPRGGATASSPTTSRSSAP